MSAVRQVGGEKQTKQVSETAKRAAMRPEGGYVDLNLTREGGRRMVLRRDRVEIGNSGLKLAGWCAREIVRLNPRSARVYQTLAENYRVQDQLERAIRIFQYAVQADPQLPDIHLALAEIYLEQGKQAEARKAIEQELAIVPESVAALALRQKLEAGER